MWEGYRDRERERFQTAHGTTELHTQEGCAGGGSKPAGFGSTGGKRVDVNWERFSSLISGMDSSSPVLTVPLCLGVRGPGIAESRIASRESCSVVKPNNLILS
jgi:hypothetical protein